VKVSIIVVGYNGEKYLDACMSSLVSQNFPSNDYEIIYVDNASKDKSVDIVRKYTKIFKNIRIIRSKKNLGFAGGNNLGFKYAKGEYILLFNQDAIADRNLLVKLVKKADSDKRIGVLGCKIYYKGTTDLYFAGGKIFYGGFCWNKSLLNSEGECDYVSGCSMLIRRDILNKVGFFDELFFTYYEETDLCSRIKNYGYKIYYVPYAVAWHDIPKKRERVSPNITYFMHRNRVLYCFKNYKHKFLFLLMDIFLLYNIFALYEIIRVPRSLKFIKYVLKARYDSIRYCLYFLHRR